MRFDFKRFCVEHRKVVIGIDEILIGEYKHGDLVFRGKVERPVRKRERLLDAAGGKNDPREFPMACIHGKFEVGLLGTGREPGGRGRAAVRCG